jgi:hypothetical protein
MDGYVAFLAAVIPVAVTETRDLAELSVRRTLGLIDRVEDHGSVESARMDLGENTVDKEGHVVVDDVDGDCVRDDLGPTVRQAVSTHLPNSDRVKGCKRFAGHGLRRKARQAGRVGRTDECAKKDLSAAVVCGLRVNVRTAIGTVRN